MSRKAQLADGTVLEFPDGTSDEVIQRTVKKQIQARSQPQTRAQAKAQGKPRKDRSILSMMTGGAVEGMGDLVDLGLKAGNLFTGSADFSQLLVPDKSKTLSGQIVKPKPRPRKPDPWGTVGNIIKEAVVNPIANQFQKPETGGEKILTAGARALPGMLIPGGGAKTVGGKTLEAASNFLSGASGEAAAQAGGGPIMQTIASLLGGVAPTTAANMLGKETANTIAHSKLSSGRTAAAGRLKTAVESADETAEQVAERIRNSPEAIPGSAPTMAERARNEGLAALERQSDNTRIAGRRLRNAKAREAAVVDAIGEGDPNAIQRVATRRAEHGQQQLDTLTENADIRRQEIIDRANAEAAAVKAQGEEALAAQRGMHRENIADIEGVREEALADITGSTELRRSRAEIAAKGKRTRVARRDEKALQDSIEKIGPTVDREFGGEKFREGFVKAWRAAKDATRQAYDAVTNVIVPIAADQKKRLFDDLTSIKDQYFKPLGASAPKELEEQITKLYEQLRGNNRLDTDSLMALDSHLADMAGTRRIKGLNAEASFIDKIRDTIDSHTDDLIPDTHKELAQAAKGARRYQGKTFEQGRLGSMMERGPMGSYKVEDLELVRKLVTVGDAGGTLGKQIKRSAGLKDANEMVSEEFRRLVDEGVFDKPGAMAKYREILKEFPAVKQNLDNMLEQRGRGEANLARLDAEAAAKQAEIAELGRQEAKAQRGLTRQELRQERYANQDTSRGIRQANTERELAQSRKSARAKAAFEKQTANEIRERKALNTAFKNSPLGKTISDGELTDPVEVISGMLSKEDGRQFKELATQIFRSGDDDAITGLRRALSKHVERISKSGQTDANDNFLPSTEGALKSIGDVLRNEAGVLTSKQREVLEAVHHELAGTKFVKGAGVAEAEEFGGAMLPPVKTAFGRQLLKFAVGFLDNSKRVDKLIQKAILEPDFAATLLERPTLKRKEALKRALRITGSGAAKATALQQSQEE